MLFADFIPLTWLPLLIFVARIFDVSLDTIRIIFVSRGMKGVAALLGFFEILVWITVVAQVITNLNNWMNYLAYAAGFATGNYVGIYIEQKLKVGTQVFRIITRKNPIDFLQLLRRSKLSTTVLKAEGLDGEDENVLFTIVKRKQAAHVIKWIHQFDPQAFYSIEDVKYASSDDLISNSKNAGSTDLLSFRKGV